MSEIEGEYAPETEPERAEDALDLIPEAEEGEFVPAETSSPEVPLEESRKDETSLLATDRLVTDSEGNVTIHKK